MDSIAETPCFTNKGSRLIPELIMFLIFKLTLCGGTQMCSAYSELQKHNLSLKTLVTI